MAAAGTQLVFLPCAGASGLLDVLWLAVCVAGACDTRRGARLARSEKRHSLGGNRRADNPAGEDEIPNVSKQIKKSQLGASRLFFVVRTTEEK